MRIEAINTPWAVVMLRKLSHLKNIGRFRNCQQKAPELLRLTLVYAGNGRGKTTLCDVMRSLQSGDPALVQARRTLGQVEAPAVRLQLHSGDVIQFRDGHWTQLVPEIRIFDATFVRENVHTGDVVTRDNKRSLLRVAIGGETVALASKLDELDEQLRACNREIDAARRALRPLLRNFFSPEDYAAAIVPAGVSEQVTALRANLDAARASEQLQRRPGVTPVRVPVLSEKTIALLRSTVTDISDSAMRAVEQHLRSHRFSDGSWTATGTKHIVDDECPFCGQPLRDSPVAAHFKAYFAGAAGEMVSAIETVDRTFAQLVSVESVQQAVTRAEANALEEEAWRRVGAKAILPTLNSDELSSIFSSANAVLKPVIERKLRSPFQPIDDLPTSEFAECVAPLRVYNEAVDALNREIARIKAEARSGSVPSLERSYERAALLEKRNNEFSEPATALAELLRRRTEINAAREETKAKLDERIGESLGAYQRRINKLLASFGADFKLVDTRTTYVGQTPNAEYRVEINGVSIPVGDAALPTPQPTFKTTLSGGDKSALAFAFFVASVEKDPQCSNLILVFDDPFASQDRSRRAQTAYQIRSLAKKTAQVIVLSHDPLFLAEVQEGFPPADLRLVQLAKSRAPDARIEEWDIEAELESDHIKDWRKIRNFIDDDTSAVPIDVSRALRPFLETHMRLRSPHRFTRSTQLATMIEAVEASGEEDDLFDLLDDIRAINVFDRKYHHGGSGTPDPEEVRAHALMLLEITGSF